MDTGSAALNPAKLLQVNWESIEKAGILPIIRAAGAGIAAGDMLSLEPGSPAGLSLKLQIFINQ